MYDNTSLYAVVFPMANLLLQLTIVASTRQCMNIEVASVKKESS